MNMSRGGPGCFNVRVAALLRTNGRTNCGGIINWKQCAEQRCVTVVAGSLPYPNKASQTTSRQAKVSGFICMWRLGDVWRRRRRQGSRAAGHSGACIELRRPPVNQLNLAM